MRKILLLALITGLSSFGGAQRVQSSKSEEVKWTDATAKGFYCRAPANYVYRKILALESNEPDPMQRAENIGNAAKFLAYSKEFDESAKKQPPEGLTNECKKEIAKNNKERAATMVLLNEILAKLR